jgi:hypothetical protein
MTCVDCFCYPVCCGNVTPNNECRGNCAVPKYECSGLCEETEKSFQSPDNVPIKES